MEIIKNMFSVSVHFDHNFYFKTHTSKNTSQIADAILIEIKDRSKHLFLFFNWMSLLTSFMFLWIFLRYKSIHKLINIKNGQF